MGLENFKELLRPYYLKWFYFKLFPEKRPNLGACWDKPHFPLDTNLDTVVAHNSGRPDLLFLPMTDWHARIQRTQHLAMNFGELGFRCFYLNPHLGRQFDQPFLRRESPRLGLLAPQVLELHVHLPSEPIYHHRLLTPRETSRIVTGIGQLVESGGTAKIIQFVSFPLWWEAAVQLKREFGFPIVYDCHDLVSGFRSVSKSIIAAEPRLLEHADLVCFSSQWLLDEALRQHPAIREKSVVVRNAVNPNDYAHAPCPKHSQKPTVGYVGALDFWFDIEAVRQAATRHPEWNFVLIGHIEYDPVRQLSSLANLTLAGEVPYSSLPGRMCEFDVGIIPFLKMPLTLATNPLKLYEYFCLGIPVVATRLPEIEMFGDLAYLSDDPADFVRQIEQAIGEDDASLPSRRKTVAQENSWRARCEQLIARFAAL